MMQRGGFFLPAELVDMRNRKLYGTKGTTVLGKLMDKMEDKIKDIQSGNIKLDLPSRSNQSGSGLRRRRISLKKRVTSKKRVTKKKKRVVKKKKRVAKKQNGVHSRRLL